MYNRRRKSIVGIRRFHSPRRLRHWIRAPLAVRVFQIVDLDAMFLGFEVRGGLGRRRRIYDRNLRFCNSAKWEYDFSMYAAVRRGGAA